jgi:1,4-dihydroxy-2-naphthoate octaprenyltransferase
VSGIPDNPSALRVWWIGARPHTLPAAAAPVVAGGGLAAADGAFAPLPFLAALAGALAIQVGTNLANDYFDWAKGADTDERRGFTRITQSGLAPPERVRRWMIGAFGAAFVPGAYLVWVGGWPIAALGLAAVASGLAYTGGPFPLGYHGLGELFVFLFFGLAAVAGTHYVQALRFAPDALIAGAGMGALSSAILVVNNLRDRETDARAGKRTLAVRLGVRGSRAEYGGLILLAAAAPVAGVAWAGWSPAALLATAATAAALPALRAVLRTRDPGALDRALTGTGRALALYGLLLAVGLNL